MIKTLKIITLSAVIAGFAAGCSSIDREKEAMEAHARKLFFSRPSKANEKIPVMYRKELNINNKTYEIIILDYKNYKKDELTITEITKENGEEKYITIRDLERFGSPDYGLTEIYKDGSLIRKKFFCNIKEIGIAGEAHREECEKAYKSMLEEIQSFNDKNFYMRGN